MDNIFYKDEIPIYFKSFHGLWILFIYRSNFKWITRFLKLNNIHYNLKAEIKTFEKWPNFQYNLYILEVFYFTSGLFDPINLRPISRKKFSSNQFQAIVDWIVFVHFCSFAFIALKRLFISTCFSVKFKNFPNSK